MSLATGLVTAYSPSVALSVSEGLLLNGNPRTCTDPRSHRPRWSGGQCIRAERGGHGMGDIGPRRPSA